MNRIQKILLLCLVVFLFFFIYLSFYFFPYECPFQRFLHIACPGCGLTRSFLAIFRFDFIASLNYNLLGIPLFLLCIVLLCALCIDIIFKKNYFLKIFHFLEKHSLLLLIIAIINMIINNIK